MTARDNKLIVTRRILTLIPAAWIALTLFFALIDSPINPEAADRFDPKNSEYYLAFDTLLAVAFFAVAPAVLLGLCVQVFCLFEFRDKKSILSGFLFLLLSAWFVWVAFDILAWMVD